MIDHLEILGILASLIVGVAAVAQLRLLARSQPHPLLRPLKNYMALFNLVLFGGLVASYFQINLGGGLAQYSATARPVQLAGVLVVLFLLHALAKLVWASWRRSTPPWVDLSLMALALLAILAFGLRSRLPAASVLSRLAGHGLASLYNNLILLELPALVAMAFMPRHASRTDARLGRSLAFLLMTRYLLALLIAPFVIGGWLPPLGRFLVAMLLPLWANLLPAFWLRRYFHPALSLQRDDLGRDAIQRFAELWALSPREHEILALLLKGESNKQIAATLFLALSTVKNHVSSIFRKTGARSRYSLIAAVHDQAADASGATDPPPRS